MPVSVMIPGSQLTWPCLKVQMKNGHLISRGIAWNTPWNYQYMFIHFNPSLSLISHDFTSLQVAMLISPQSRHAFVSRMHPALGIDGFCRLLFDLLDVSWAKVWLGHVSHPHDLAAILMRLRMKSLMKSHELT